MPRNTVNKRSSAKLDTASSRLRGCATKQRRPRVTGEQVMVVTMFVRHNPTTLDVIKIPTAIARDKAAAQELADSYKDRFLANNPQFAKNKFLWQVKSLR